MQALFSKLPPSVTALLLQFSSFLFAVLLAHLTNTPIGYLSIALLTGVLAAIFSYLSGLASWWIPIQLAFAPALVLALELHIPSEFFLLAFLIMLAIYWSTFRSQVPLYLSSKHVWKTLEELLPTHDTGKRFTFMDIGSGMSGVLIHLADVRPDGDYYGVENAPLPYLLSRIRLKLSRRTNCQIMRRSLWDCDLSPYDVVFAYLSPVPMEKLWHKVKREMRPGTLFISNSFTVPEQPPQYSITLDDMHHSTLHIWHI